MRARERKEERERERERQRETDFTISLRQNVELYDASLLVIFPESILLS